MALLVNCGRNEANAIALFRMISDQAKVAREFEFTLLRQPVRLEPAVASRCDRSDIPISGQIRHGDPAECNFRDERAVLTELGERKSTRTIQTD
jgi:hypothetical protein